MKSICLLPLLIGVVVLNPGKTNSAGFSFDSIGKTFSSGIEKSMEKIDKFGVFLSSKLNGDAGKTWTTFQFAPNPVPYDKDFGSESEAWRRVTQNLSPGTHTVRFELWGEQGQYRSREPLSVGEFNLLVGQGDRVAAGMQFPGDSYTGNDVNKIRDEMIKAVIGPVAKNRKEILKLSVTSDWRPAVYTDTKKPYRKISGTVLWHDKNNDSIWPFHYLQFHL